MLQLFFYYSLFLRTRFVPINKLFIYLATPGDSRIIEFFNVLVHWIQCAQLSFQQSPPMLWVIHKTWYTCVDHERMIYKLGGGGCWCASLLTVDKIISSSLDHSNEFRYAHLHHWTARWWKVQEAFTLLFTWFLNSWTMI